MKIQISDIKLPEHSVATILSVLESNDMPTRVPDRDRGLWNCWGFTAYYCGWEKMAFWMDSPQIRQLIDEHTKPISKENVKAGDIAVFYQGEYLSHTAILLPGGDVICHKPGGQDLCIDTVETAKMSYGTVTYVRVVKKVKKEFDNCPKCVNVGV